MKKVCAVVAALLFAGSLFFCAGSARGRVRSGVTAEGIEVGGLPVGEAVRLVREEIAAHLPPVVIETPQGEFSFGYPALSFTDNLPFRLKSAKWGEKIEIKVRRTWAREEEDLLALCALFARDAENASLRFSAEGFSYSRGKEGVCCDYARLLADCTRALSTGERVTLRPFSRPPAVTEEDLRARTRLLSSFYTSFDPRSSSRAHNVRLAAERIGGTTVPPGGEFSFNQVVGRRTRENGFEEAAIILNGEFTAGVGGGVCQTSTTLFGAALRAGMTVVESRPHSLSVSYVPPSQDAMVSEASDLRFVNPRPYPVYILARTERGRVGFEFYGMPDGRRYEVESRILRRLPPPSPEIAEGTEDRVLRQGREGTESESYLSVYENGVLLSRTLIRRDVYAPVRGKEERAPVSGGKNG